MDLLSQDNVDQFRAAMRSVTDTFHKSPVTLRRASGEEIDLLAGLKPDDQEDYSVVHGERYVRDAHSEMVERWVVSFNRDYLAAQGLMDPETGEPLINPDDWIVIKGKRFAIIELTDRGLFRGIPILLKLIVQR
ncbi:hypothetical protein [Geobacter sp. SVR]|uniref:hypothetical protein n=1 Tax=Geobacter sp. SVR TaxID=2495594 RepID=UPI00143EF8A9|nr:hypothetical protein [Geobacter sp. SVR]BCS54556.1 hypothetical protein GSVR_28640 [Geobacter sp. SVR]GCF86937.1 hypothetical protein GSbR_35370 [Geobacter sp. SVR]